MNFAGRPNLVALTDQLIRVSGGTQVDPGAARPVLVLEGIGGSGRSRLLRHTWDRWYGLAPTAFVDSPAGDGSGAMCDVLRAVMLGLTADVPGYPSPFRG